MLGQVAIGNWHATAARSRALHSSSREAYVPRNQCGPISILALVTL